MALSIDGECRWGKRMKLSDNRPRRVVIDSPVPGTSRKLQGLRVTLDTDSEEQLDALLRELARLRVEVTRVDSRHGDLAAGGDIILCDYSPDLEARLPWAVGEATAALIVMLPQHEPICSAVLEAATPDAVLARPFTANAVKASVVMGYSQFRYECRLRGKAAKLEDSLRAVRAVEQAKAIVMSTRLMSSEQAYQYIRSQAMARRVTVSQLAEAIVSSYGILGDTPRA